MTAEGPITEAQRAVIAKLAPLLREGFYLAGGVAVAAHLGHLIVEARAPGTLHLKVDGVPVSVIEYRYPLLTPASPRSGLEIPVASLEDLACMKLSAIAGRGAARDFWDLHTIVTRAGRPLGELLATFRRKYPVEDLGHVVRSLAYFGDARGPLPAGLTAEHWAVIQRDFQGWVRAAVRADPA